MRICDLISNPEFNFNVPFRIQRYVSGDEPVTVFDSTVSGDISFDIVFQFITAINMGDDGVVEIEYAWN